MERIYHSPNFANSEVLGEIRTQEVVSTKEVHFSMGTKLFVSSDMKGAGLLKNQGFR
jgi:hypothetical protein